MALGFVEAQNRKPEREIWNRKPLIIEISKRRKLRGELWKEARKLIQKGGEKGTPVAFAKLGRSSCHVN